MYKGGDRQNTFCGCRCYRQYRIENTETGFLWCEYLQPEFKIFRTGRILTRTARSSMAANPATAVAYR